MDQLYSKKGGERFLFFFQPKSCWAQESTIQTFILLSNSATHGGTTLKNCLDAVLNKRLIRHLIIWKTLHFKALINKNMVS